MPDAKVLRKIYDNAQTFALHDPDVRWPSPEYDNPIDAIIDELDRCRFADDVERKTINEMLEPVEGFDSKLEWLAEWLDFTDKVITNLSELAERNDLIELVEGDDVQTDLRRWANELRRND